MCTYTFHKDSFPGLEEKVVIHASSYLEAKDAVIKHINRQAIKKGVIPNEQEIPIDIMCQYCCKHFEEVLLLDTLGNKNKSAHTLLYDALAKSSRYRTFKKLHSHHVLCDGLIKPDGLDLHFPPSQYH